MQSCIRVGAQRTSVYHECQNVQGQVWAQLRSLRFEFTPRAVSMEAEKTRNQTPERVDRHLNVTVPQSHHVS